jgi:hypothetical protein
MWFHNRKVLLTKDNFVKRQWKGCKRCSFCDLDKTIEHLFLPRPFAEIVWRIVFFTYKIPPPTIIKNMFGHRLSRIDKKTKVRIRIGVWACFMLANLEVWSKIIFNTLGASSFFCRLSIRLYTGSNYRPSCSQRISGNLWLLNTTVH